MRKGPIEFILAILLLGMAVTARADGGSCGNLSADDCALLHHSRQVMAALPSAAFHLEFEFIVRENPVKAPVTLRMLADGTYTRDLSGAGADGLSDFDRALHDLAADLSVYLVLAGLHHETTAAEPVDTEVLAFDLRLVEGIGYLNPQPAISNRAGGDWYGVDLAALYRHLLASGYLLKLPTGDWINPAPLVEIGDSRRLADDERHEQSLAVLEVTVDFNQLLENPMIREVALEVVHDSLRQKAAGYDEDQLWQAAEKYAALFENTTLRLTRSIGLDDGYLHRLDFALDFRPDAGMVAALAAGPDPFDLLALAETDIQINLSLSLERFGTAPPISAPEDPVMIPLDELAPWLQPGSPL
jgi:hypothetical protein